MVLLTVYMIKWYYVYTLLIKKKKCTYKKRRGDPMTEEEKKEKVREQNRKAVKKYREKTISFAVKYSAVDAKEGQRLKAYLEQTDQTANSYIKRLIKEDLDKQGWQINIEDAEKYRDTGYR